MKRYIQQSQSPVFRCPADAVFLVDLLQVIIVFPTDLLLTCWDELVFVSLPGAAPPPCPLAFLHFSRQSQVEPQPAYKQVWQLSPTGLGTPATWPSYDRPRSAWHLAGHVGSLFCECVCRFEEKLPSQVSREQCSYIAECNILVLQVSWGLVHLGQIFLIVEGYHWTSWSFGQPTPRMLP